MRKRPETARHDFASLHPTELNRATPTDPNPSERRLKLGTALMGLLTSLGGVILILQLLAGYGSNWFWVPHPTPHAPLQSPPLQVHPWIYFTFYDWRFVARLDDRRRGAVLLEHREQGVVQSTR